MSAEKSIMPKIPFFIIILVASLLSCKKDNDNFPTGTVQEKNGCFSDSWLVSIDNPDPSKYSFLRATGFTTATFYNCSNAVIISLPSSLAKAGTRVMFSYDNTIPSCLSYSEAPNHITVKKISGF